MLDQGAPDSFFEWIEALGAEFIAKLEPGRLYELRDFSADRAIVNGGAAIPSGKFILGEGDYAPLAVLCPDGVTRCGWICKYVRGKPICRPDCSDCP